MAKPKRRRAFAAYSEPTTRESTSTLESGNSIGNFFRDRGVRETVESVVIAIMLALLFRCFEAEAFIIPTGSMAVSLYGEHMDVECKQCGYQYQIGASNEDQPEYKMVSVFCPICQYNMQLNRDRSSPKFTVDHESFDGDRILANKFIYDFVDPKRWDVLIFKNPNNPKQNYIKRCIGLPNETILIENGDIYTCTMNQGKVTSKTLQRKPPQKIWHMLQEVDDTNFIAEQLKSAGWPSRWNEHDEEEQDRTWKIDQTGDRASYSVESQGSEVAWLRYRHMVPRWYEWNSYISSNRLPPRIEKGYLGELIADYYAYNHSQRFGQANSRSRIQIDDVENSSDIYIFDSQLGLHWVGDLCVDAELELTEAEGKVSFQLIEGGAAFNCTIDLPSGKANLSCDDPSVQFVDEDGNPTTETESAKRVVRGTGKYQVRFANYDDRLAVWVNKKLVKFGNTKYLDYKRTGKIHPRWSPQKGKRGDAEPVGIGVEGGAALTINRIRIFRDIYYVATTEKRGGDAEYAGIISNGYASVIRQFLTEPAKWSEPETKAFFDLRTPEDDPAFYKIADNSFMPMGDNSPASLDARSWSIGNERAPPYFDREFLSGRAMLIYWPHSWNWPPFYPNFRRMGFIH